MPVATSYSEASFASFLDDALGPVADVLGWTAGASYGQPIAMTLRALGHATIDQATDLEALEKIGLREAWRRAVQHLATKYRFSVDQQSFDRKQMQDMAKVALAVAEADALPFDRQRAVRITGFDSPHDPYGVRADALGLTAEAAE